MYGCGQKFTPRGSLALSGLVAVLLFTASCVSLQKEIAVLRNEVTAMDKRVKKLEASMAGQTSDAELERKLSPIRQRQAETGADLHKIRGEITRLSGMTSENRWLIEKSTKQQGSKIEAMGKQLSELENDTAYLQDYLGL